MQETYDSGKKTPCYGCENRRQNCHSECDDYAAFAENRKAELKDLRDKTVFFTVHKKKERIKKPHMRRY